jgi:hypothetical protein
MVGLVPKRKQSYSVRVVGEARGSLGLGGAYILPKTSSESVSGILHSISHSSHHRQILEHVDFEACFTDARSFGIGHLLDVSVPVPPVSPNDAIAVGDGRGGTWSSR